VTRQETTFIRTISRNQTLQTKTPEKEYVNVVNSAECETHFQAKVLIFAFSGVLVNAIALTLLLESCARKSDSVAAF